MKHYSLEVRKVADLATAEFDPGAGPEHQINWLDVFDRIETAAPIIFALIKTILGRKQSSAMATYSHITTGRDVPCSPDHHAAIKRALGDALDLAANLASTLATCKVQ